MPNTFSRIYLQIVFAVQNRESLIQKKHKEELHKFLTSLVQARNSKMLAVHAMPDHAHLFIGYRPNIAIPELVKIIKTKSNEFINDKNWNKGHFNWQDGYGVFSYGHSQIDSVCQYVLNQEIHHKKKTFKQEYISLLEKFGIPFEEQYLFKWLE